MRSFVARLDRRSLRRAVTGVALAAAAFALYSWLLTDVQYRQQQSHRAAQFAKGTPTISRGDAVAILQIEKLGINVVVAEGDSAAVLRGGPGHLASTPLPGEGGNAVITGRSSRYGSPFGSLGALQVDDQIVVAVKGSDPLRYAVAAVDRGHDRAALASDGNDRLTLVTADGPFGRDYTIVTATRADGGSVRPATAIASGTPTFESRQVGAGLLSLLIRCVSIGVLFVVGWRLRPTVTPAVTTLTVVPLAFYGLLSALPFEPFLSNLW